MALAESDTLQVDFATRDKPTKATAPAESTTQIMHVEMRLMAFRSVAIDHSGTPSVAASEISRAHEAQKSFAPPCVNA
jgi:hypothetical protein